MDELRELLDRVDPVPAEVTEFARAALGWRRLDAVLGELLSDSALEAGSALVRSEGDSRWLTFRAADFAIDVEVRAHGAARSLLGQLAPPPASATVEVQAADGAVIATAESDALGRFRLELEAGGRIRLRVSAQDPPAAPVETSWLSL
jgi:hypothetical protein